MADQSAKVDPLDEMTPAEREAITQLGSDGDSPPGEETPEAAPTQEAAEAPAGEAEETTEAEDKAATVESAVEPEADPRADERFEKLSKALQKVQQDIATLGRKKESQGGELTEAQERKVEELQQKGAALGEELADVLSTPDEDYLQAGGVKKMARRVQSQDDRLRRLEEDNVRLQRELHTQSLERFWQQQQKDHEGVDVKGIWDDALKDAEKRPAIAKAQKLLEAKRLTAAEYEEMLRDEATQVYQDRVKVAKAPADARKSAGAGKPKPPHPTAQRAPATTPGGASLTQSQGGPQVPPPMTVEEFEMDIVRKYLAG